MRGVLKPSQDRGCDEPTRGVHRHTALGCTFNSLGSERYLLTEDNRAIREAARAVPYDVLSIMVNHTRYGGGGIYNLFNTFTSDNQWSGYVFVHEFGHGFAGLADEYYSSSTAYTDFYPAGVEPVERNITRLLDGKAEVGRRWSAAGVPVPTPWAKAELDAMDARLPEAARRTGRPHREADDQRRAAGRDRMRPSPRARTCRASTSSAWTPGSRSSRRPGRWAPSRARATARPASTARNSTASCSARA